MTGMDGNKFPHQLFPSFYNTGPPNAKSNVKSGSWGLYNQAFEVNHCLSESDPGQLADWKFDTQCKVKGETWKAVEPMPVPLMAPSKAHGSASGPVPSAADFPEHMQNFYLENYEDAFSTMSSVLGEHFHFGERRLRASAKKNTVHMSRMKHFLSTVNYRRCPLTYFGKGARRYMNLLDDVIHDIPPFLLAELLREELLLQSERAQFNEVATGGALGYFPVRVSNGSQEGCLVFPEETSLKFHKVVLDFDEAQVPRLRTGNSPPLVTELSGAVRQISVGDMQENVHVGVRSDYHCGVWLASPQRRVMPLETIRTERVATCICVSPHIPGELLVASENGAVYLWTVGKGLSKIREEEENLYFNAQSSWRWCDFSAHPKVIQFTDRTGMELTDTRSSDKCSYTLFRIGETPNCKSGERVILSKYLNDVNAYHHLVTTQHSAYIMDERLPCLPMLKWDHMLVDPPLFTQVLAGSPQGRTNKVLLGSQRSQELMFLQYSGGEEAACRSMGPPLKLPCLADGLGSLRLHVPHRLQQARDRLGEPTAGFTAIHHNKTEECLCVLQLSETGDIFYQTLTLQPAQDSTDTQQPRDSTGGDEEHSVTTDISNASHNSGRCSGGVSTSEGVGTSRCDVELISDDEHIARISNTEMPSRDECSANQTGSSLRQDPMKIQVVSKEVPSKWDWWLKALFESPRPTSEGVLSHWTMKTKGLISCQAPGRNPPEEDQLRRLREDLQEAMKRKDVLVHGETRLRRLDAVPLPDPVATADWSDNLSQRLSVSWGGRWKSWWEDKLGMNRQEKVAALRRKRQRQKRARAHWRVGLSESFASSLSLQSDLDNLSGWSSGPNSQGACSDVESISTNPSVPDAFPLPERAKVSSTQESRCEVSPLATLETADGLPDRLQPTPRKARRPEKDYLSSLFGSRGPSEGHEDSGLPPLLASCSQGSAISLSQRNPCVAASNKGSTSSQPRKKRPRMGF
ncbi:TATA box-binding protein-associated factor, RNA polymerase I, subunit C-like isoform X1 [Conger conger]|uniref:TATA box-binding protein-associated factor, RNA polymerase I, subunit C-like isoform X1 n=1 Tax=Conger conger TaxID=82655 RepID=UPI002A5A58EA|nr:TATA box-binding protein-associated factor, RNA polymerase I, subunit C-like isoform X1 [Conger conger]XP_061119354.1 TATA box-binding protein-associated factor, RNA polymerase I, subunit C-like isoform X1 [Conger conger]